MSLYEFAAEKKRAIYADLLAGKDPSQGTFDKELLAEGRRKGDPQIGSETYRQDEIDLQFIFPEAGNSATILTVTVPSPERIVYLTIPKWVVISVWQGEVFGTYAFESDAEKLVQEFLATLEPQANPEHFGEQTVIGRS